MTFPRISLFNHYRTGSSQSKKGRNRKGTAKAEHAVRTGQFTSKRGCEVAPLEANLLFRIDCAGARCETGCERWNRRFPSRERLSKAAKGSTDEALAHAENPRNCLQSLPVDARRSTARERCAAGPICRSAPTCRASIATRKPAICPLNRPKTGATCSIRTFRGLATRGRI